MATLPDKNARQGLLRRYLSGLSFPKLFLLFGGLFVLDLFIPDPFPFFDEVILGIVTVMVGMLRDRSPKADRTEVRAPRPRIGD
jgi:Family of unknown function (DUF6116)